MPRRPHFALAVLALGALLLVPAGLLRPAHADETELTPEEEERLEAVERHTEKGWKAFRTGNHEEVLARMKRLGRYDPKSHLPAYLSGRVYERTGEYQKALDAATAASTARPEDRRATALRFKTMFATGRHETAATAARAALAERGNDLVARCALGMTYEERGRRKEALAEYDKVVAYYNDNDVDPAEVPWVAEAAVRATWLSPNPADDMFQAAIGLLQRHLKENPEDTDAKLVLAEIFRQNRGSNGQALAGKNFAQILKQNSEVPEARVGQARKALMFYRQSQALKELDRALETNPNLVSALSTKAAIHIGNGDYKRGLDALERALKINPRDKESRAIRAALHYIRGETEAFETLRNEILKYDPKYGELYLICAELVGERQRRYDIAADLARKAIEVDPDHRNAYVVLGEALMNRGQTDEALENFKLGVVKSKRWGDVRRDNWIEVLSEWMPKFKTVETENFRIRMPLQEWHVMQHYLPDLLEESHEVLTRKYGIEVEKPTYADSFHRSDDFSVRSVGSPGLPALGVCFGNTITLLGPTSKPVGQFSWSRTAWHEFAHVVTLQQSKGQVPRWLTEGLSVFEEKQRRERWGRDMERQLYDRWRNGRLLKMSRINQAFRGPDILFAYYQGGLIADHLTRERGFDVIPQMLKAFAKDKSTAQVFQEVLELDLDRYDEMFSEYVKTIVGEYKLVPRWDRASMAAFAKRIEKNPKDAEALVRMAWGHLQRRQEIDAGGKLAKAKALKPDHPEVILLEGRLAQMNRRTDLAIQHYERFLRTGYDDLGVRLFLAQRELQAGSDSEKAVQHLEAAKACFPRYVGRDSPYLQLAKLYRGAGQMDKAMAELEAYAAIAAEDYGVRKELKAWHKAKSDHAAVARICHEMIDITPYGANVARGEAPDMELHRDYAAALVELGRTDEALRERKVQVALARLLPEDKRVDAGAVKDLVDLGNALLDAGDAAEALSQAIAALRLAPRDASALMLKRRAQEAGGAR
ncbi:MAG: tetratricopeptide repeat protein [Planctomycetota bacterium]|nr:tetratricopeptide repeat protein [Planctomycetota bacterium]